MKNYRKKRWKDKRIMKNPKNNTILETKRVNFVKSEPCHPNEVQLGEYSTKINLLGTCMPLKNLGLKKLLLGLIFRAFVAENLKVLGCLGLTICFGAFEAKHF